MRRLGRSLAALAVGFGAGSTVLAVRDRTQQNSSQVVVVGDLDLWQYCEDAYGDSATAVLVGETSYGWRCAHRPNGVFVTVQMRFTEGCHSQFGDDTWARTDDERDAYSWRCVRDR